MLSVKQDTNYIKTKLADLLIKRGVPIVLKGGVNIFEEREAKMLVTAAGIASGSNSTTLWNIKLEKSLYAFARKLQVDKKQWGTCVKSLSTYLIKRNPSGLTSEEALNDRKSLLWRICTKS